MLTLNTKTSITPQPWLNLLLQEVFNMKPLRHSLMLLWFADLMNVTKEVTIHRPSPCNIHKP